jgi:hypothetical protein
MRQLVSTSEFSFIAAGIVGLLAVFAFLSAVLMAQRGRTAAYYSVRRETQQRANHKLMLSLALLLFAGILFAGGFMLPRDTSPAGEMLATAPAPTITVAATNTVPASSTSASPIATPALVPTAPARPTLAPQSTASLASPLPTPIVEPTLAPAVADPNKRLVLSAIASGRDENGQPVGSGTSFQAGTPTLYVFFDYRDVPPDALLRHTWFRDGGSVNFSSQRFNENGAGVAAIQWSPRGGFKAGLYEVRVQLGGAPQFVANFEVK